MSDVTGTDVKPSAEAEQAAGLTAEQPQGQQPATAATAAGAAG